MIFLRTPNGVGIEGNGRRGSDSKLVAIVGILEIAEIVFVVDNVVYVVVVDIVVGDVIVSSLSARGQGDRRYLWNDQ